MIRLAIAMTVGFVAGAIFDLRPVRTVRSWYLNLKLHFVLLEIVDTCDDIVDLMHDRDWLAAEGLTDFYAALCNERDDIRKQLADLA